MERKIEKLILQKIQVPEISNKVWCDSLLTNDEKFSKISITIDINECNYVQTINIHFITENPPNFIFTGKISVNEFNTRQELELLIKKQVRLANLAIADAILRAAQIDMFV